VKGILSIPISALSFVEALRFLLEGSWWVVDEPVNIYLCRRNYSILLGEERFSKFYVLDGVEEE